MALHYVPEAFTFNGTPGESSLRDREQALPESLCYTSSITRVLCFVAIGCPDLEDHWESLQSAEAFEKVRGSQCSILSNTISAASLLLATSGVFVTTGSPVSYFAYTSPATYFLLFMSLMMAMIAMLTSGLNMIRWLQADRQWTREQLMPGGYFLLSYLLSIVIPILFVGLSLNCFIFAMLVAGFYSQNTVCRILTTVWLVIYVVSIGTILMEFAWKYAKCLKSR
ncbi:hypothetical protein DEU56DRAFT_817156 [Suillus clintonianus]|uniref:uncharacterized protein n=1 Tax=Suillus clintonianus TaxID=1904413 RepID=UPI001B87BC81|nr:uncharacterized protein DEU56DRAFT_817156 [Suillus clintonianus]KAG2129445.1 hypothetical protein DEU56DRAFT_817156 [Suillus clintonianus]